MKKTEKIEKVLMELESFVSSIENEPEAIDYSKHDLRQMFLWSMENPENYRDRDGLAAMAKTYCFLDQLLESLKGLIPDDFNSVSSFLRNNPNL